MTKLKIATLHCFGSNPLKHANQRYHFTHCADASAHLAEWIYPPAPNTVDPEVVRNLLKNDMVCSDDEVEAFGFEDPRCWFRFSGDGYAGLEASIDYLTDFVRRERPDGIAGYSNGGGMALLTAALAEGGNEAFQSIRFVMSFAGSTSPTMQRHIREFLGVKNARITMPAIMLGSARDLMLANADQMAKDLFDRCEIEVTDRALPFANHALPDDAASYAPIVRFLERRRS